MNAIILSRYHSHGFTREKSVVLIVWDMNLNVTTQTGIMTMVYVRIHQSLSYIMDRFHFDRNDG